MRSFLLLPLFALAPIAGAQSATAPAGKVFDVTPYAGYMLFGNFLNGPLGTSLATTGSPVFGAEVGITVMPGVAIVGNIARASGNLQVGLPLLGGVKVGTSTAVMYDGGLRLSLPVPSTSGISLRPFVQAGVGGMHYDINLVSVIQARATNLAWNVGGGIDLPMGSNMAVSLMAKDYIGKFDFKQATSLPITGRTAQNWALTGGVRLAF